jgi:hypothetical protein
MVFNIVEATSPNSINQLFQAYTNGWNEEFSRNFSIKTLYKLWYYTSTLDNDVVECRMYYEFTGESDGYYCNFMNYNTTTGLYIFVGGGNRATSTSDGLTPQISSQLTLYYTSLPLYIQNIEELYKFLNGYITEGIITNNIDVNFNLTISNGIKNILSNNLVKITKI